jgi:hypothetical protein
VVQLAVGVIANAQQPAPFRIGWLSAGKGGDTVSFVAFRSGLRDYGYVKGRNLTLDARWGKFSNERTEQVAAELVRSNPQVIVLRPARQCSQSCAQEQLCQWCLVLVAIPSKPN